MKTEQTDQVNVGTKHSSGQAVESPHSALGKGLEGWRFDRAWRNVVEWSKDDWIDFYRTLRAFKLRAIKRSSLVRIRKVTND